MALGRWLPPPRRPPRRARRARRRRARLAQLAVTALSPRRCCYNRAAASSRFRTPSEGVGGQGAGSVISTKATTSTHSAGGDHHKQATQEEDTAGERAAL
jgi:hypothetical protein